MSESTAVAVREPASETHVSVWQSPASFEAAQRMASALVRSPMVPEAYRGIDNMGSALIALDIAQRTNSSPLMVMQNLHIIGGRPSWGASFIIAALNACGKFSPIRFRITDYGDQPVEFQEWTGSKAQGNLQKVKKTLTVRNKGCVAYCIEKATGEVLEGPEVTVAMAVAEGWYTKRDSKWPTMTDLMLRYRAAAFFGRLYAPDLLMGMQSDDEARDISDVDYVEVRDPSRGGNEQWPANEAALAAEKAAGDKPRRASRVAAAMATQQPEQAAAAKTEAPKVSSGRPAKSKDEPKPEPDRQPQPEPDHQQADTRAADDQGEPAGDYSGDEPDDDYTEQDGDHI